MKRPRAGLKDVSTLGQRVSISWRSETFIEDQSFVLVISVTGSCGQETLVAEPEPQLMILMKGKVT